MPTTFSRPGRARRPTWLRPPAWMRWPTALSRHGSDPVVATAALAQVATIAVTWPLWSARTTPPTLPVLSAADVSGFGVLLAFTAAAAVLRPRVAGPLHCAILALAVLGDQTRLQPEMVSLAILLTAPAFGRAGRQIARWHLATMWLWSGLHKALSYGWASWQSAAVARDLGLPGLASTIARVVPATELLVGVAGLVNRARPVARWGGAALHLGILVWLSPVFGDRNIAVWAWNGALVVASLGLFGPDERPWRSGPRAVRAGVLAVLLVAPGAYYWRGDNAYLSHHLYSASVPTAQVCGPSGCDQQFFRTDGLRVPFPPEPRLYRQRFEDQCLPGTTLVVTVPETRLRAASTISVACPP